jgi:predicted O-methyltransferase YrrM
VSAVLARLHRAAKADRWRFVGLAPSLAKAALWGDGLAYMLAGGRMKNVYVAVSRQQGQLLYLVARSIGARRIVEFGASFGVSTTYLAAAVSDNGGGQVISTEIEPGKHAAACKNLSDAGLARFVDLRLGDAEKTLVDVEGPVDMVLLDGWKQLYLPVLELLVPKLRKGAVVFADNIYTFKKALAPYVEYVQSGDHGFRSITLPVADGFEFSTFLGLERNSPRHPHGR